MNNSESNTKYGPLPLVIGITGHRDLRNEDVPALERIVRGILAEIRAKCPHTPLLLLSPLADGADRLAARVALAAADELGLRLIVPLPMRGALYEQDFNEQSRAEFAQLLARADHWFELPVLAGHSEDDIRAYGPARDRQYEQVGAYIVRHSHILLALWDGVYNNLVGGTSQIMQFQLQGVPKPYASPSPLDAVETGPVYHILTPRRDKPLPKGTPLARTLLFPPDDIGQAPTKEDQGADDKGARYDRIYARMDKFNYDAVKQMGGLAKEYARNRGYLFPAEKAANLPTPVREQLDRYAVADTLAIFFQQRNERTLRWLYGLVLLAAIFFGLYAHFLPERHLLLLLYLTFMLLPLGVYRWAKHKDYQNKYQDYRALAEGMRVQFSWCLAQLKMSVADHYLRKQKSELDWIRSAIRVWNIADEETYYAPGAAAAPKQPARLALVLEHWVADQAGYFRKTAQREHEALERHEWRIRVLVWVGLTIAVLLALLLLIPSHLQEQARELLHHYYWLHGLLLTLLTLPLAMAGLLHNYVGKLALSEHIKQYERTSRVFKQAEEQLRLMLKDSKLDAANELLTELGREALEENGDWVLLHRERPPEVPLPG